MAQVGEQKAIDSPVHRASGQRSLHEAWVDRYGLLVAEQLRADEHYALVRVGDAEFAFTDYDLYLRALGQAWEAGFVTEPLPSTKGSELLSVAPNLRGVNVELAGLSPSDVGRPRRFA